MHIVRKLIIAIYMSFFAAPFCCAEQKNNGFDMVAFLAASNNDQVVMVEMLLLNRELSDEKIAQELLGIDKEAVAQARQHNDAEHLHRFIELVERHWRSLQELPHRDVAHPHPTGWTNPEIIRGLGAALGALTVIVLIERKIHGGWPFPANPA